MARAGRDEVEAAYFTLLRAREELTALRRYGEYLEAERRRIQRFVADGDALEARVDPRLRRGISHTDDALAAAIRQRLDSVGAELDRLPGRIADAEAYVAECERDHAALRAGR